MGYGMVITLLADFRDDYGFSGLGIGVLGAASFVAGIYSQLFLAKYADRGLARTMVRAGLVIDLVAMVWMASTQNIWQFIAARVLLGLGAGLYEPAVLKIVISRDPDNMGHNLGKIAVYETAGFILSPLAAALIAQFAGLRWPFIIMAVIYVAAITSIWNQDLASPVEPSPNPASRSNRQIIAQLLRRPGIQNALWACVAFSAAYGVIEVSWALLLADNGAATWLIGLTLSIFAIPMLFLAPLGGRVAQQRGALKVVVWSQLVSLLCMLAYGWTGSLWVILAVLPWHGLTDVFAQPGLQVAVSASSPKEHIAAGQGLLNAVSLAVAALVSLAGGGLYAWGGGELLYPLTAALMGVALLLATRGGSTRGASSQAHPQSQ